VHDRLNLAVNPFIAKRFSKCVDIVIAGKGIVQ